MSNFEVPQPILNSPYEEPRWSWRDPMRAAVIDDRGNGLLVVKKLSEAEEKT